MMSVWILLPALLSLCGASNPNYGPPPSYGTPTPPSYGGQQKCEVERCTNAIINPKISLKTERQTETIFDVSENLLPHTHTDITIHPTLHVKPVCTETSAVTIWSANFVSTISERVFTECVPNAVTDTVTKLIPMKNSVIINQCVGSTTTTLTHQSVELNKVESEKPTFSIKESTAEWTQIHITTVKEEHPICTETLKCEHECSGYGCNQHGGYGPPPTPHY